MCAVVVVALALAAFATVDVVSTAASSWTTRMEHGKSYRPISSPTPPSSDPGPDHGGPSVGPENSVPGDPTSKTHDGDSHGGLPDGGTPQGSWGVGSSVAAFVARGKTAANAICGLVWPSPSSSLSAVKKRLTQPQQLLDRDSLNSRHEEAREDQFGEHEYHYDPNQGKSSAPSSSRALFCSEYSSYLTCGVSRLIISVSSLVNKLRDIFLTATIFIVSSALHCVAVCLLLTIRAMTFTCFVVIPAAWQVIAAVTSFTWMVAYLLIGIVWTVATVLLSVVSSVLFFWRRGDGTSWFFMTSGSDHHGSSGHVQEGVGAAEATSVFAFADSFSRDQNSSAMSLSYVVSSVWSWFANTRLVSAFSMWSKVGPTGRVPLMNLVSLVGVCALLMFVTALLAVMLVAAHRHGRHSRGHLDGHRGDSHQEGHQGNIQHREQEHVGFDRSAKPRVKNNKSTFWTFIRELMSACLHKVFITFWKSISHVTPRRYRRRSNVRTSLGPNDVDARGRGRSSRHSSQEPFQDQALTQGSTGTPHSRRVRSRSSSLPAAHRQQNVQHQDQQKSTSLQRTQHARDQLPLSDGRHTSKFHHGSFGSQSTTMSDLDDDESSDYLRVWAARHAKATTAASSRTQHSLVNGNVNQNVDDDEVPRFFDNTTGEYLDEPTPGCAAADDHDDTDDGVPPFAAVGATPAAARFSPLRLQQQYGALDHDSRHLNEPQPSQQMQYGALDHDSRHLHQPSQHENRTKEMRARQAPPSSSSLVKKRSRTPSPTDLCAVSPLTESSHSAPSGKHDCRSSGLSSWNGPASSTAALGRTKRSAESAKSAKAGKAGRTTHQSNALGANANADTDDHVSGGSTFWANDASNSPGEPSVHLSALSVNGRSSVQADGDGLSVRRSLSFNRENHNDDDDDEADNAVLSTERDRAAAAVSKLQHHDRGQQLDRGLGRDRNREESPQFPLHTTTEASAFIISPLTPPDGDIDASSPDIDVQRQIDAMSRPQASHQNTRSTNAPPSVSTATGAHRMPNEKNSAIASQQPDDHDDRTRTAVLQRREYFSTVNSSGGRRHEGRTGGQPDASSSSKTLKPPTPSKTDTTPTSTMIADKQTYLRRSSSSQRRGSELRAAAAGDGAPTSTAVQVPVGTAGSKNTAGLNNSTTSSPLTPTLQGRDGGTSRTTTARKKVCFEGPDALEQEIVGQRRTAPLLAQLSPSSHQRRHDFSKTSRSPPPPNSDSVAPLSAAARYQYPARGPRNPLDVLSPKMPVKDEIEETSDVIQPVFATTKTTSGEGNDRPVESVCIGPGLRRRGGRDRRRPENSWVVRQDTFDSGTDTEPDF